MRRERKLEIVFYGGCGIKVTDSTCFGSAQSDDFPVTGEDFFGDESLFRPVLGFIYLFFSG